jgi:excisionase family DNA binding protein
MTSAELAEIGDLFRAKLRHLREQERSRAAATQRRRSMPARKHARLESIDSPPGDGDVLSPSDLARLLGVQPRTVTRWAADGGLPSFRTVGGHRRYRWADVATWLGRPSAL